MATAVIDIGKTTAKLAVVDATGAILASLSTPNHVVPGPPYPHYDVEALWRFILDGLAELARQFPIDAIVPVTHGASGALIDDHGLVLPILDYECEAPQLEADYDEWRPEFEESLSPPLPGGLNLGRQFYWLQQRFPEAFARTRHMMTYPQFWAWRLGGRVAGEVTSLACHGDLWAPMHGRLSSMVEKLGWTALFPPLEPAWATLGFISAEVQAPTGLGPECRVVSGIHDSNASYLVHLVARPRPFAVVSTGTWVVLLSGNSAPVTLDPARDMLSNVDATGHPVPCQKFMGGREYALIAGEGAASPTLAAVAEAVAAGTMALPSFVAQGGPFSHRAGSIMGDARLMTDHASAVATLYLALMTDYCLTSLNAGGPVIVEGSFARNEAYAAVLAAIRPGSDVLVSSDATGTVRGAALLARWPNGFDADPTAAAGLHRVAPAAIPGLDAYVARWRTAVD